MVIIYILLKYLEQQFPLLFRFVDQKFQLEYLQQNLIQMFLFHYQVLKITYLLKKMLVCVLLKLNKITQHFSLNIFNYYIMKLQMMNYNKYYYYQKHLHNIKNIMNFYCFYQQLYILIYIQWVYYNYQLVLQIIQK